MPTVVEALQEATTALNNATAQILSIRDEVAATLDAKVVEASTVINNFVQRPPVQEYFLDAINGNDANDGVAITRPKRNIDTLLGETVGQSIALRLMSDVTISVRHTRYAFIDLQGIQASAQAPGFIQFERNVNFLGTATNSPQPILGSFCSGMFLQGAALFSAYVRFNLPSVPAGNNYRSHFTTSGGAITITQCTLTSVGAAAGALIGANTGKATAFVSVVMGTGAAGHIFDGIAAGQNPNAQWMYDTNVTSG